MLRLAIQILMGDRAKYLGLLVGIAFTAFLITFAMAYFSGFMTRGFALISENPNIDVWVMDPAVSSTETTINIPASALARVRSIKGVANASPLALADVNVRFANGHFQQMQMIGVGDASLTGSPVPEAGMPVSKLHLTDSVIVDPGGTTNKLQTPSRAEDIWPYDGLHLNVPMRLLMPGDELLVNDKRLVVADISTTIPRFPPRPLIYTTYSNLTRILPQENKHLTFVLVSAQAGTDSATLARRINQQTGYRARTASEFKVDTVHWYLINSEDVGDMVSMLIMAMSVGFGVTGIMLYMFTYENLPQYALLKAIGANNAILLKMVFLQAASSALLGAGIGIGLCALSGELAKAVDFPFRLLWFAPLVGILGVIIVSITAALISIRPLFKLEPGSVFTAR